MFKFNTKLVVLLIASLLFFSSVFANNVAIFAQNSKGVGILPSNPDLNNPITKAWIIEKVEAGKEMETSLSVNNYNDYQTEIQIHAADSLQAKDGTFTYRDNADANQTVGKWINIEKESLNLAPKSSEAIKVKIKVPQDTKPGEYAAVVSVQEKPKENKGGVQLLTRVGARIYITVPGELKTGVEIKKAEPILPSTEGFEEIFASLSTNQNSDQAFVSLILNNSGNIYSKVNGELKVEGPDGWSATKSLDKDLAPFSSDAVNILSLENKWKIGKYKLTTKFNSSPLISFNKSEEVKATETESEMEFEITQETLEKLQQAQNKQVQVTEQQAESTGSFQILEASSAGSSEQVIQAQAKNQDLTDNESSQNNQNWLIYTLAGFSVFLLIILSIVGFILYKKSGKKVEGK